MTSISKERPTGITILAAFCLIYGAYSVLRELARALAGIRMVFAAGVGGMLAYPVHVIVFLLSDALPLGAGALLVFIGIGLFKLRNWARVTLMVLIGLRVLIVANALAVRALHAVSLGGSLIAVLISAGVVIYLFQPQVKRVFGTTGF